MTDQVLKTISVFTAQLKRRRLQLKLTQAEVAKRAGIRQANYSRMESGRQTPNLETLLTVLHVLGLKMTFADASQTVYHPDDIATDVTLSTEKKLSAEAMVMFSGSSAGTQPKYYENGYWYKTDRMGYEGMAEHLMSVVLSCSDYKDYVFYESCTVNGRSGCRSANFLKPEESFISFQRLYDMYEGGNLSERILPIKSVEDRIAFVKQFVADFTGIDCSSYLSCLLSLDMLSLNTDRHFHNLGIIANRMTGTFRTAPVFDNADALLSNYDRFPADEDLSVLISSAYAQPFSANHEMQAKAAGLALHIDYNKLHKQLDNEPPSRAVNVLRLQLEKYKSVFS